MLAVDGLANHYLDEGRSQIDFGMPQGYKRAWDVITHSKRALNIELNALKSLFT